MNRNDLRFHSNTMDLLGVSPSLSQRAVAQLDAAEVRIGRKLPTSIREWYSLEGACGVLARYSNDDPPLAICDFGPRRIDTPGDSADEVLARDSVVFRHENQGVCAWAFALDADDPPVHVGVESRSKTWTTCSPTFSEHLYAWIWDYALVLNQEPVIQAQNAAVSQSTIDFLKRNFDPGPVTHGWPGHTQYRFSKAGQLILIWANDDQADWWIKAMDQDSMRVLIKTIKHLDQVVNSMWSDSEEFASILRGLV